MTDRETLRYMRRSAQCNTSDFELVNPEDPTGEKRLKWYYYGAGSDYELPYSSRFRDLFLLMGYNAAEFDEILEIRGEGRRKIVDLMAPTDSLFPALPHMEQGWAVTLPDGLAAYPPKFQYRCENIGGDVTDYTTWSNIPNGIDVIVARPLVGLPVAQNGAYMMLKMMLNGWNKLTADEGLMFIESMYLHPSYFNLVVNFTTTIARKNLGKMVFCYNSEAIAVKKLSAEPLTGANRASFLELLSNLRKSGSQSMSYSKRPTSTIIQ